MRTNIIVHSDPSKFNELLREYLEKAEKEGSIIRDIKYSDNGERYSALLMIVKLK